MQNRAKMKADQAQKKAEKVAAIEAYRSKKPGECLKVSAYFASFRSWLTI
jgi:Mlc titration factor MtfA (ptsG expression regulator)